MLGDVERETLTRAVLSLFTSLLRARVGLSGCGRGTDVQVGRHCPDEAEGGGHQQVVGVPPTPRRAKVVERDRRQETKKQGRHFRGTHILHFSQIF